MNIKQLLEYIVRPTLIELGMHSLAAERLVMGTITQESNAMYIKQMANGPALGLAQMEPATHDDIWKNFLKYKPSIAQSITRLASLGSIQSTGIPDSKELISNISYAVAMCRAHYYRRPEPLPNADDIEALGKYWKQHYNTHKGKGTASEFVERFPYEIL